MRNKEILKLVAGFRRFRGRYFENEHSKFLKLSTQGQRPKTLIIGCSDSRVDPALITSAEPGEIFVVRNVANLVPPYEDSSQGFHGVSAAIEFAVNNLQVQNIVILGHRQCGGIRALMSENEIRAGSFLWQWMRIVERAKQQVEARMPTSDLEEKCHACEKEGIVVSLQNLMSFPFVRDAVQARGLNLFGIFFDIEHGVLQEYSSASGQFETLIID